MRREVLVALLLLAAAVPLGLSAKGPLNALVAERLAGDALPAPPTLLLLSPHDGEGVGLDALLVGEARSDRGRIADLQLRVDGARWSSIPDAPRGERASAFRVPLALAPGDHVVEVRASDGDAWSLPARVVVRAAEVPPPTVRIVTPRDGDGVTAGEVEVLGTVHGAGPWSVRVRVGGEEREARITGSADDHALWSAVLPVPPGVHEVHARATGAGGVGLERRVTVAAGEREPPTLTVVRPEPRSSFGSAGSEECPTTCVLFAGVAAGPDGVADVLAALDEGEWVSLSDHPAGLLAEGAAWSWRLEVGDLYSGPHVARFVPVAPDGTQGAPRAVEFMLRTPRSLLIEGDDAPRPSLTPLAFRVAAAEGDTVRWTLDGQPLPEGPRVEVLLPGPGDHVLVASSPDEAGRMRTARLPLFALNRPPVVTAIEVEAAPATLPTRLLARATDADGNVTRYAWDFGDGEREVTTTPDARHAFPREGTYVVKVTAHDDAGGTSVATPVVVAITNAAPLASFRWSPERPTLLDDVTFHDSSRDPEGRLVGWSWDFGDGTPVVSERAPTHRFAQRGPRTVTLTVMDVDGGVASRSAVVDVQNVPPQARFTHRPLLPETGQVITFTDATAKPDGRIMERVWDFGNGALALGETARHAFDAPGRHPVTLTVTDDWGVTASVTLDVDVRDAAPLVDRIEASPPSPNATQAVRLRAVATDLEGDVVSYVWDLGDGTNATGAEVVHAYARSGRYEVTVAALDAAGQRGVLNLTLVVQNARPLAQVRLVDGGYANHPTLLQAEASDPDGTIVSYAFDLDDDGFAECSGPKPACSWVYAKPGAHLVRLTVTDDEGGEGYAVLPLEVRLAPGGVAAPTVAIAAPQPGAVLKGQLVLEGAAVGHANLTLVEAQLRDETWSFLTPRGGWLPADGTSAWRLILDTRGFPDGAYVLAVRATDETGARNETAIPVTLANGPRPTEVTLRVLNLAAGQTLDADHVVRGTAYHPEAVTSVRWRVDDDPWRTAHGLPVSWTIPLALKDLRPGPHVLVVEAYRNLDDRATVEVPFRVPDVRPVVLVDVPPNPTLYARLRMEGDASPGARVAWRVDAGLWQDAKLQDGRWLVDAPTDAIPGGPHVLSVKAIHDRTGIQSEPIQFHVRVLNPTARASVIHTADAPEIPDKNAIPLGGLLPLAALAVGVVVPRRKR